MMLRRPPGEGRHVARRPAYLLALAVLALSCIPLADAQQQQQKPLQEIQRVHQHQPTADSSEHETLPDTHPDAAPRRNWAATHIKADSAVESSGPSSLNQQNTKQQKQQQQHTRRSEPDNIHIPNDASAVATLAPARFESVRAPPSGHRPIASRVGGGYGISTQHHARSLKDWEVEDFVLLATVDGHLYASDRKTATERWHLEVDQSMVETTHYRLNTSDLDDDYNFIDHYVWAIEPNRDGDIYYWVSASSEPRLLPTGLTMKQMVDEGASALENPPIVYTGTKKTTMITLDAATGRVLKWFGSGGSHVNEAESCLRPNALYDQHNEECSSIGTITLGRTEYEVGIARKDGRPIATLKYFDWTPNTNDYDLLSQHDQSIDNKYHTTRHDGKIYGIDYSRLADSSDATFCKQKFPSPVVKVFDVCRPYGVMPDSNPDLIVLPQPAPPAPDESTARTRNQRIFVNQTETGNWYALSGRLYPLIVDAPAAKTSRPDWYQLDKPWGKMSETQRINAMIGTHHMDGVVRSKLYQPPSLPGRPEVSDTAVDSENDSSLPILIPEQPAETPTIVNKVKSIPHHVSNSVIDFFSNPVLIVLIVSVLFFYQKDLRRWYKAKTTKWYMRYEPFSDVEEGSSDFTPEPTIHDHVVPQPEPIAKPEEALAESHQDARVAPVAPEEAAAAPIKPSEGEKEAERSASITQPAADSHTPPSGTSPEPGTPEVKKKKPAHRGRRGGTKHRKGKKREEMSQSRDDEAPASVEDAVMKAKKLGGQVTRLEPDVVTVANDMQAVSGPIIRMGNIEVDTDNQLGTGSNGTLVFAGKFDGREVAVKRMLIQFYDIASQETKLLRESDDHPNVIRYYAQQVRDGFLYIALERCAASLADVVERPHHFSRLAQAGKMDLPGVLYQITNGIHHLHNLRIVHRDLKPQNILVNMGKDGRPRLLVSDFGLCKKLEGGQSSFGATTGRAAGTSGWRAPELLLDDDAKDSALDASINSGSGSILVGSDMMSNRRATRSIDIFSLGLVFFYVLTNGLHPFDCGDRYMREVNIRKGNYNLTPLDALGDFAFEAKHLISLMLNANPKERPTAREVMAHPFFWPAKKRLAFLCDVSDHFEKEPRDPPSDQLAYLEKHAQAITKNDFLRSLPREFVDSLGKQRKYTGSKLLDLLRALRNKKNHYEDMPDTLKRTVGSLPDGYLAFWTVRFPRLLLDCWQVVWTVEWDSLDRFKEYYEPAGL